MKAVRSACVRSSSHARLTHNGERVIYSRLRLRTTASARAVSRWNSVRVVLHRRLHRNATAAAAAAAAATVTAAAAEGRQEERERSLFHRRSGEGTVFVRSAKNRLGHGNRLNQGSTKFCSGRTRKDWSRNMHCVVQSCLPAYRCPMGIGKWDSHGYHGNENELTVGMEMGREWE